MKLSEQRVIAYIAGRLISKLPANSVYDYQKGKYTFVDGTVNKRTVEIFDYDQGCHISGESSGSEFSLFHYGSSHFIDLRISGNAFEGFDYGSSTFFSGDVNGGSISLFDYQKGNFFQYSID